MKVQQLYLLLLIISITFQISTAQFGIGVKKKTKKSVPNNEGTSTTTSSHYEDVVDFHDDPELQEAIQQFADMSPEDMKATILDLKESIGVDGDPETLKELDSILEELAQMDSIEMEEQLQSLMEEEAVAHSMAETMELLSKSGDDAWEKIISKKDLILESVIQTGVMSEEEIATFRNDPGAWEEELKEIWKEMKAVAAANEEL